MNQKHSSDNPRKALRQLPTHTARPDTWQRIEQQLDADNTLQRSIAKLPVHQPRPDTWSAIAQELDTPSSVRSIQWPYAAAAIISLLIVSGIILISRSGSQTTTYTEEWTAATVMAFPEPEEEALEEEAWEFIQQHCLGQPVCQSEQFQTLKAHWEELDAEEAELQETLDQFGYDPSLIKYQVRIQNMKADATKELIQLVM